MKSPNNGGGSTPTGHLFSPKEASSTGTGLQLLELLANEVSWKSPKNPGCWQDHRLLSTNSQKAPLLKTMSTQLTGNGEVKLVSIETLHPYVSVFWIE